MIQAKCIQKFRNKQNKIYGYRLQDINGQVQDVTPEDLKNAIKNASINVINLTLTSDGRLVDKKPEQQLQNKKIMPNDVKKPVELNDRLKKIAVNCANKIARAISNSEANMIDLDKSVNGYVSALFEVDDIIYKGVSRALDISIQLDKHAQELWIGLIDIEANYTEADKYIQLTKDARHNQDIIDKFTDAYIKYIKQLENKKYRLLFNNLIELETEYIGSDNILGRFPQCTSNVKLVTLSNNENYENLIDTAEICDALYPYMYADGRVDTIRDAETNFIISFIKNEYAVDTLIYSIDKNTCINNINAFFTIDNSVSKYCEYCEEAIGTLKNEYIGHTFENQHITKIAEVAKRTDSVMITVTLTD